jgi:WD40 repeat protein
MRVLFIVALAASFTQAAQPNAANFKPIREIQLPSQNLESIMFSPDGKRIAAGTASKSFVYDAATGELVTPAQVSGVVCFSADGKQLFDSRGTGTLRVFDIAQKKITKEIKLETEPNFTYPAFSADGKRLAGARNPSAPGSKERGVRLFDTQSGKMLMPVEVPGGSTSSPSSVSLSDDARIFAIGWQQNANDKTDKLGVTVIDTAAAKVLWTLPREPNGLDRRVAVAPDGKSIAVAVFDVATNRAVPNPTIQILDTASHRVLKTISTKVGTETHEVYEMKFSADGKWLVTGTNGGPALISPATGRLIGPLGFVDFHNKTSARVIAIAPDNKLLVTGHTDKIQFWDVSTITGAR